MLPSVYTVSFALLLGIALIIFLSTRLKLHPFFSLFIACFVTGSIGGLDIAAILTTMKDGFGRIMSALGFIIVLGTVLGMVLQASGATTVMANTIIGWVGKKRPALANSLTGFVVGLPIFCDSGYVVLSGLNKSMIRETALPAVMLSTALATGLYAVHCFIPPHPGVTSATGTLNAHFGLVILYGLMVAVPAMLAGYYWAVKKGRRYKNAMMSDDGSFIMENKKELPGTIPSFMPVVVPILLISVKDILGGFSFAQTAMLKPILIIGEPAIALAIGLALALLLLKKKQKGQLQKIFHDGIEKAGGILIIIGAGSAFGAVIGALKIQEYLADMEGLSTLGLFFPFLLTVILKTAQGSSTVAIITAASIVLPFLPALQLDSENGRILAVLAMGAGSMAVSHVNDAYFWVISNFSDIELKQMFRVYSLATVWMALTGMAGVYILSLFIL